MNKVSRGAWLTTVSIIGLAFTAVMSQPLPGDVFREYHMIKGGSGGDPEKAYADKNLVYVVAADGYTTGTRTFENIDAQNATKAEIVLMYWGGHVGSSNRRMWFNESSAMPLPIPENTPGNPLCEVYHLANATIEIPLQNLKNGNNDFKMAVDECIEECKGPWGWFWVRQAILRVYYNPDKVAHPAGSISLPEAGSLIVPNQPVTVQTVGDNIKRIEVIGKYRDYSWDGTGQFDTWHGAYWLEELEMSFHVGKLSGDNRTLEWNNRWIPDQDDIKLAARIEDENGMIYFTEPVQNLSLTHLDKIVKLYHPNSPRSIAVWHGQTLSYKFTINDDMPVLAAQLVGGTFSGQGDDRSVKFNGTAITGEAGKNEAVWGNHNTTGMIAHPIKAQAVKKGTNTLSIYANQPGHHPFEWHWPGPGILVEYQNPNPVGVKRSARPSSQSQTAFEGNDRALEIGKHNLNGTISVFNLTGRKISTYGLKTVAENSIMLTKSFGNAMFILSHHAESDHSHKKFYAH